MLVYIFCVCYSIVVCLSVCDAVFTRLLDNLLLT